MKRPQYSPGDSVMVHGIGRGTVQLMHRRLISETPGGIKWVDLHPPTCVVDCLGKYAVNVPDERGRDAWVFVTADEMVGA